MRVLRLLIGFAVLFTGFVLVARQIWPLPDISNRTPQTAIAADYTGRLGELAAAAQVEHPGQSGVIALSSGADALASRLALINRAKRSIDAQYYIWHDDISGILMLDALLQAAKRGVRVRLLLDDNGVPGLDRIMATLNAEPNFYIRLYNPSTVRQPKLLGYSFDFLRMNRRMHNKSLIVDGAAVIIGGRNIGDEYFQIGQQFYVDLDVLAIGRIVSETVAVFDQYWNSGSVFELESIVDIAPDVAGFNARVQKVKSQPETAEQLVDTKASATRFAEGNIQPEWTSVKLVADDPIKGQGQARRDQLMIVKLGQILGEIQNRLDLVSAYFVPGQEGTEFFAKLARSGKKINILTNALDTTDVLMVHAGYTKYRRELLKSGANLFELKLRGGPAKGSQLKPFGLSGASLHAKTFAVDEKRIFIGSFNFDPRSALLNTEMGLLIDSPALAGEISRAFDEQIPKVSYRPELTPEDKMVWQERDANGKTLTYQQEPGASWTQQAMLILVGLLPVEWLL